MRATTLILGLAVFFALPAAAQERCENPGCKKEPSEPVVCTVYDGLLAIEKNGSIVQERVLVQYRQIENDVVAEVPHQGMLILELRAGSLIARTAAEPPERHARAPTEQTADDSQEYSLGSFWSVPADRYLFVQTARDSVVLQTVDLIPQEPR